MTPSEIVTGETSAWLSLFLTLGGVAIGLAVIVFLLNRGFDFLIGFIDSRSSRVGKHSDGVGPKWWD